MRKEERIREKKIAKCDIGVRRVQKNFILH